MIIKTYSSDDNLQPQFSNQYSKKIFCPHLKLPAAAEKSILLPLIRFPAFDSSHWALKRAQGMRWGSLGESKPRKYLIESKWRGIKFPYNNMFAKYWVWTWDDYHVDLCYQILAILSLSLSLLSHLSTLNEISFWLWGSKSFIVYRKQ